MELILRKKNKTWRCLWSCYKNLSRKAHRHLLFNIILKSKWVPTTVPFIHIFFKHTNIISIQYLYLNHSMIFDSHIWIYYTSVYTFLKIFKEIKMLLFHIFNTETIDRSIVFKTIDCRWTIYWQFKQLSRIFYWTSLIGQTTVIAMRDPLALSSLSRNPDLFVKISKISWFQNFQNILKISVFIKFHKISKFKKKFKNLK